MKKLIPALALLLVSAVMLATSSFAWFSMNTSVTVTGMSVKTSVGDNLLIAPATGTGTATMPAANTYRSQVSTKIDANLEPVSSVTGLDGSFFYTSVANVDSAGDATSDVYVLYNEDTALSNAGAGKSSYDDDFNSNYSNDSVTTSNAIYGYVDYVFALQATNTQASADRFLRMTKCDLNCDGTDSTEYAFRVAVLLQECTNATTAQTSVTTKTILAPTGADYFVDGKAINDPDAAPSVNVENLNTPANLATIAHGETKYYKVTVRLWLEGEDESCNNATFATLTDKWTLDLKFALVATDGANAVSVLNKVNATQYTISTSAANVSASNVSIGGTTFYAYTATAPADTTIYGNVGTGASNVDRWFTINGNDVFEITEFVTKS